MFFRMIKRDLKRRKSMNLILLVFVFLVSAFISASVGVSCIIKCPKRKK